MAAVGDAAAVAVAFLHGPFSVYPEASPYLKQKQIFSCLLQLYIFGVLSSIVVISNDAFEVGNEIQESRIDNKQT